LQPVLDGTPPLAACKLKQNANEGCNSCASLAGPVLSFIACFILLVIAPDLLDGVWQYMKIKVLINVSVRQLMKMLMSTDRPRTTK